MNVSWKEKNHSALGRTVLFGIACLATPSAFAAPGDLDLSFAHGTGFRVDDYLGSEGTDAHSALIDSDSSIIVSGATRSMGQIYPVLTKYRANGSIDKSFGNDGFLVESGTICASNPWSAVVKSERGKLYHVVHRCQNFEIYAYTKAGKLNRSYGVGGLATIDPTRGVGGSTFATFGVALDGENLIIAGGTYPLDDEDSRFTIMRVDAKGALDSTFGDGGVATSKLYTSAPGDSAENYLTGVVLQRDGKSSLPAEHRPLLMIPKTMWFLEPMLMVLQT